MIKHFFIFFLVCNRILSRKTKTCFKRKLVKGIKIFVKNRKTKSVNIIVNEVNLSRREKHKQHQYDCERNRNLPEDEKQRLFEYIKSYSKIQKKEKKNWLV